MSIINRKTLVTFLALSISSCSFIDKTDINALKQAAINDAMREPEKLKLDYTKCYGLDSQYKQQCYEILSKSSEKRKNAASHVYTSNFDKEMELQGFAAFLRSNGKKCDFLTKNPEAINNTKTYSVMCNGGYTYKLSFAKENLLWRLVE